MGILFLRWPKRIVFKRVMVAKGRKREEDFFSFEATEVIEHKLEREMPDSALNAGEILCGDC
ncbi:hypothetical protein D5281_01920 [bacterium 1xD42-62]|uniref:Uncharacterized protein n=1 Tax=Parablautia muri TaxID=2320879 RepID=A0A9X5GQ11_9FIRM|nr:hypothetical protein [Parablautia muri]